MPDIGYLGTFQQKRQVKLLVLNPVTSATAGGDPVPLPVDGLLSSASRVDEVYCPDGPVAIDDSRTAKSTVPLVVDKVVWAEAEGYDAVLINCMLDPGLREAAAAVSIPVVGLRQATHAIALMVGDSPAFFDPEGMQVTDYRSDPENTYAVLLDAGRRKVNLQGADVLVPNCAYLGGLAGRLQEDLGVPVLANRDIALRVVELLANFRLRPEPRWVGEKRSPARIFLTKLYRWPVVGPVAYGLVGLLKTFIGVVSGSRR